MKKKLAVLLVAALTLGMTACGASKGAGDTGKSEKSMVYAVEAGSAGEEAVSVFPKIECAPFLKYH